MWIRGSGSTIRKVGSEDTDPDPLFPNVDPDPRQNEMDPKRCLSLFKKKWGKGGCSRWTLENYNARHFKTFSRVDMHILLM